MNPFSVNKNILKTNITKKTNKKIIIHETQKELQVKSLEKEILSEPEGKEYDFVVQNILKTQDIQVDSEVNYCFYNKNENNFLEYILEKNNEKEMILPNTFIKNKSLYNESNKFINNLPFVKNHTIIGYFIFKNNIYVFVDIEKKEKSKEINYIKESNVYWWVCVDEIINQKKVLYFSIDKRVTILFLHHPQMCFLYNEMKEPFEIPTVLYFGTYYKFLNYAYSVGLPGQTSKYMKYGSYFYYLTDYNASIRYAGWTVIRNNNEKEIDKYGRFEKGGVIRCAVFLKDTKYFLNRPYDKEDDSELAKEKDKRLIKMTDYDGLWSDVYNSVYSGITRLVDDDRFTNIPMFVIRNFNQIHSLSLHIVDKSSLGEKWSYNDSYKII